MNFCHYTVFSLYSLSRNDSDFCNNNNNARAEGEAGVGKISKMEGPVTYISSHPRVTFERKAESKIKK